MATAGFDAVAQPRVARVEPHAREVAGERADVLRDRHLVVVEHDDEPRAEMAGVVERLERHAAGHRAVTDDGDDPLVAAARVARLRQSRARTRWSSTRARCRRRRRATRCASGSRRRRRTAAAWRTGRAVRSAACRRSLVADVPDDAVLRGVERAQEADA